MTDMVPESTDYLGVGGGDWDNTGQDQAGQAFPVHIASSSAKPGRKVSAEYGDCMNWTIDTLANMGKPLPIMQRRYRREKARILVATLNPVGTGAYVEGQSTAPAANAIITGASISATALVPGWYTLKWSVDFDGTPGAGEVNNVKITGPPTGGTLATAICNGAVGHYPQEDIEIYVSSTNASSLNARAIAAGTAGAIYSVAMALIPLALNTGSVVFNSRQEPLMQALPVGYYVSVAPYELQWENQKPCYAVLSPGSSGPITVSVLDQAYEET
jgi:hypothetical protein